MNLPKPCTKCEPSGGNWMETEAGLKRCDCERGVALREAAKPKPYRSPVISPAHATMCAEMLAAIPYFPGEAGARAAVANEFSAMCATPELAAWLATRMIRLYRKWPGLQEMRWVFCNSERPIDGIEAIGESEVYPDGIPSEKPAPLAIAAPPRAQMAIDGTVSAAASVEATVRDLVTAKNLNLALAREKHRVREIPERQVPTGDRITQEHIDAAVRELREKRASDEIEGAA